MGAASIYSVIFSGLFFFEIIVLFSILKQNAGPPFLRPANTRRRHLNGLYLTSSRRVFHLIKPMPLSRHHDQRSSALPTQHAGEASAIKFYLLQYFTAP